MPLARRTLALPADPPSVRTARSWVSEVLEEIGRPELVMSAQLAVSELVTNAILHSDPPVTVRVAGTLEHPRIEVTDNSVVPPAPPGKLDGSDLNTTGRGLTLVALHSECWGADVDNVSTGKTVWFEPSSDLHEDGDLTGQLLNFADPELVDDPADLDDDDEIVTIVLRGVPVQIFLELRAHYTELRREIRLLTLSNSDRYPEAQHLNALFQRVNEERLRSSTSNAVERATTSGRRSVDIEHVVPARTPETMGQLLSALEDIYNLLEGEALLAVLPVPLVLDLQRWYLEEFVRQAAGEEPRPWTGPLEIAPDADAS